MVENSGVAMSWMWRSHEEIRTWPPHGRDQARHIQHAVRALYNVPRSARAKTSQHRAQDDSCVERDHQADSSRSQTKAGTNICLSENNLKSWLSAVERVASY